jgi:hypothetical protein
MTVAMLIALLAPGVAPPVEPSPLLLAQLSVRQQVIIRVPARPVPPPVTWKERNGPRCIPAGALAGALISREGVDLLLRGGNRVRARLGRGCPPLDYYSGFYIRPGADGRVCEDRDSVRVRSGGSCQIERFRKLVPSREK